MNASPMWVYLYAGGAVAITALTALTSAHVLLHKRDARAAVAWIGFVWLAPLLGVFVYWAFGVNRIRRRAHLLFAGRETPELAPGDAAVTPSQVEELLGSAHPALDNLAELGERVTSLPLMAGNRVDPLVNGDEAYPRMLEAVEAAAESVSLSTYIFDNDAWGRRFREALAAAVARGVEVRVLVDDVGARYSMPSIVGGLRRDGVTTARFMRSLWPWRFRYYNLRSHRKILVADGRVGFTGGMNIRAGHVLREAGRHPVKDLHFRIEGPVVAELQKAFADDWKFTAGETLEGPRWFPPVEPCGPTIARAISDGPDEDFDKLRLILLGALACAQRSVRVATPYFLPDSELAAGLQVAALRGVRVEVVLPEENNLTLVRWASTAALEDLEPRCRVFLVPPPFDHSKVMVVDDAWVLLGSANWDSRSLLLNFELNVECYDPDLAVRVNRVLESKLTMAREVTAAQLRARPLPARLRDRFFRLFSPYL
ncbi:MAG: phospholipase D-like domain-containing protein [Deferrisomatales bacterium]